LVVNPPDLGMEGLSPLVYAQDLQTDPDVSTDWSQLLASAADPNAASPDSLDGNGSSGDGSSGDATALRLADDASGLRFYSTLYDDASTAKTQLTASASVGFSALLLGGDATLSGKFDSVFTKDTHTQYLVIQGVFRGQSRFVVNPVIHQRHAATMEALKASGRTTATWAPFDKQCANMYVAGVIPGANVKIVIAFSKDTTTDDQTNTADLKSGKVTSNLTFINSLLQNRQVTNIAVESNGGPPVLGNTVDALQASVQAWMGAMPTSDPAAQSRLPTQYAILEPYTNVPNFMAQDGKTLVPIPPTLFPDPLGSPRGKLLREYRDYYLQISALIGRLQDGGADYAAPLKTALAYRDSLRAMANKCIAEDPVCSEMPAPSSLGLKPPPATKPQAPSPPDTQPVRDFTVNQSILSLGAAKLQTYSDDLCSSVAGGYGLPSSAQLKYLLQHPEKQYKNYSLAQWVPSGGIWTNVNTSTTNTIFSVDIAKDPNSPYYPDVMVTRTDWSNWSENFYYVVCVR
jgi:hypothetical protein